MVEQVLDDKLFAILVLMALFTTFVTTPIVMAIYRPLRELSSHDIHSRSKASPESGLRILACIRGLGELPSLVNLINSHCSSDPSAVKVYVMRLIEMTGRSSSIVTALRTRRNGLPCITRFCQGEFNHRVALAAFKVRVRPTTSVSMLPVMHRDICHIAEEKRVAMVILPFHKQWKRENGQDVEIDLGQGWRGVNERVLANAPCSVAFLVDRGFNTKFGDDEQVRRVCVLFLGGPDSREALELGGRMADHPSTTITVIKFRGQARPEGEIRVGASSSEAISSSEELDETSFAEFKQKWDGTVRFVQKGTNNIGTEALAIAQSAEYDLIVVGKGRFGWRTVLSEAGNEQVEYEELGQIGGLLASSRPQISASVLVVHHHRPKHASAGLRGTTLPP